MLTVASATTGELLFVALLGVVLMISHKPVGRFFTGVLGYMNDPLSPERWKRKYPEELPGLQGFFFLLGASFVVYAALDWLGVISVY